MQRFITIRSFVAVVLLVVPSLLHAQVSTALVQGQVADPSGGPMSGATVVARNTDTGLSRSTTTDPSGSYRLPALPVGPYEIAVSAPGFADDRRSGVTLRVGQEAKVDFTLRITAGDAITVIGEPPIVETTVAAISTTITTKQIDDLPLLTRSFTELAGLTPGIQDSVTENGTISATGGSGSSNAFLIDGVSGDTESLGGQRITYSPDVIGEFEVLSSQFGAEFGRASGAVINVVTRSGTNDLRGRLSAYYRSDDLASDDPFFTGAQETSTLEDTTFSVFLGGPIKRDRAFYFVAFEPTTVDRTKLVAVDPALLAAFGLDPKRTIPVTTEQDRVLAKLDLNLTSSQLATLRYDYDDSIQKNVVPIPILTREADATQGVKQQNVVLAHTWIASPGAVNDFRVQWALSETEITPNTTGTPLIIRPSVIYGGLSSNQKFDEQRLQIVEGLSFQAGEGHFLKAGADVSDIELPVVILNNFNGTFVFTTDKPFNSADPTTFPLIYQQASGDPSLIIEDRIYGFYVQDEWKLRKNLTLNLGLRWDYEDHPAIENDKDNFGPRLHFAWDPFSDGKTVVRGGFGIYHDPIFLNVPLLTEFIKPDRFVLETIFQPGFPDPRTRGIPLPSQPPTVFILGTNNETPSNQTGSLGLKREIARNLAVSADLVFAKGKNLLALIDTNPRVNGVRTDPSFNQKNAASTIGRSEYRALQLGLEKRFGDRYSLTLAYTLAENENNTDSHRGNPRTRAQVASDFGPSSNDIRHTFNGASNISGPWGLKVGVSGAYRSGSPYNVLTGSDGNMNGIVDDRPAGVGRNSARTSEQWTINGRLAKVFTIQGTELELIGDVFNVFDQENEGCFADNMLRSNFGQPTCSGSGQFGPRQGRVGVRFDF